MGKVKKVLPLNWKFSSMYPLWGENFDVGPLQVTGSYSHHSSWYNSAYGYADGSWGMDRPFQLCAASLFLLYSEKSMCCLFSRLYGMRRCCFSLTWPVKLRLAFLCIYILYLKLFLPNPKCLILLPDKSNVIYDL